MICTVYRNLCFYTSVNTRNWIKYNAVYLKTIDMLNVSAPSRTPIFHGNRKDPGGLPMITNGVKQDKETGLTVWNEHYPFGKTLDNLTSFFYIIYLSKCTCTWQLKYDRMKKSLGNWNQCYRRYIFRSHPTEVVFVTQKAIYWKNTVLVHG